MRILPGALLGALVAGCVSSPAPITVELVNNTGWDVTPNLYVSASAENANDLFIDANLRTDFTSRPIKELRSGESASLSIGCEEALCVGAKFPIAFDGVTLTVRTSSDQQIVFRGVDYSCGQTVRFTYYFEGNAFRVRVDAE